MEIQMFTFYVEYSNILDNEEESVYKHIIFEFVIHKNSWKSKKYIFHFTKL